MARAPKQIRNDPVEGGLTGPFTTNYTPSASRLATNGRKNCPQSGGHRRLLAACRVGGYAGPGAVDYPQPATAPGPRAPPTSTRTRLRGDISHGPSVRQPPFPASRLGDHAFAAQQIPDREASATGSIGRVQPAIASGRQKRFAASTPPTRPAGSTKFSTNPPNSTGPKPQPSPLAAPSIWHPWNRRPVDSRQRTDHKPRAGDASHWRRLAPGAPRAARWRWSPPCRRLPG